MNGYVVLGYGITLLTLGAYASRVLARGRALRRALPPEPTAGSAPSWP